MSTSLAAQLQKLAAPQTSILLQDKKRASLLFDPKEAANYDRQTIYELGVGGLEELQTLNARFSEFEGTLFDLSSQSFERAVQSKDVNKKLDSNIKKFFYLLSPYLQRKPSHKALEWLINRFHIHQYNVDDLLMLALPYHETKVFVRIVQLVNLTDTSGKWHWLQCLQKPGVPLSKTALLNHASASPAFLKLLCETTLNAVKEHGQYAGDLSTLIAFYCTTLLGVFERCKRGASELQLTHILEALQRGLASTVLDFAAASYMIAAKLITSTSLSAPVLNQLVNRISKTNHLKLQAEKALLLVLIYQTQHPTLKEIPNRALLRLAMWPDVVSTLSQLASGGIYIIPLLVPLLRGALTVIQTPSHEVNLEMRCLVERIINDLRLDKHSAEIVVRTVIETFDISSLDEGDCIVTEEENSSEAVSQWYAEILQCLERSYPTVFDAAVCHAIKEGCVTSSRAANLKRMLGFELRLDLFDKLHHTESKIRAEALRCLAQQCKSLKEKDDATLRDSLCSTLKDENPDVVLAAFSFPPDALERIVGGVQLHEVLVEILLSHHSGAGAEASWAGVVKTAISLISNLDTGDELQTLRVILPHMMCNLNASVLVLQSQFGVKNNFIKAVKSNLKGGKLKEIQRAICKCILDHPSVLDLSSVMHLAKIPIQSNYLAKAHTQTFITLLLLTSSLPQNMSIEAALEVVNMASKVTADYELLAASAKCELSTETLPLCLLQSQKGFIPLEGLMVLVQTIMSRTKLDQTNLDCSWLNLEEKMPQTSLLNEIYFLLSSGCTAAKESTRSAYVLNLKKFLKSNFSTLRKQLTFLANFWVGHMIDLGTEASRNTNFIAQLRSLRLGWMLLQSSQENLNWSVSLTNQNILVPAILVALRCPAAPVRHMALELAQVLANTQIKKKSYTSFLQQLCDRKEELSLDSQQLQLVLYTLLSPDPVVRNMLHSEVKSTVSEVTNILLECVLSDKTPHYIAASILDSLISVNSKEILEQLLPLVSQLLNHAKETKKLTTHGSSILSNLVSRINTETVGCYSSEPIWAALKYLLEDHSTSVILGEKYTCPAVLACEQISRELWEALPKPTFPLQQRLLQMLILNGTEAESPAVVSAVAHCIKQLPIDASLAVFELNKMKDATVAPQPDRGRRRSTVMAPSLSILETRDWRCGITLLELLQNKKKLSNVQLLLPVLFDLLKRCLDFEEQAPVEYAKQLVLSCILHCCQKLSPSGTPVAVDILPAQVLNVEAVVQCVRATQNPQTHHHALLLLAHMAAMAPDQVLHNIMAIFTFMGSLVLRQDDAYSFQVISKIVDTIIPILIKASSLGTLSDSKAGQLEETVASVMRVFVDALLDIPEHRRLSLFHKLLSTLDSQQYLWLFLCLVLESHVVHSVETKNDSKRSRANSTLEFEAPKRLEVALQIVTKFSPDIIIANCVRLMHYVRALPMEKDEKVRRQERQSLPPQLLKFRVKTLFNVEHHSPKQLRHYKYTIITFLSALMSSVPFVNQVSLLNEEASSKLEPLYREMLESVLAYVQTVSRQSDICAASTTAKYWRVMVTQTCDILDKVNALLPSALFLSVVSNLMAHEVASVRRKAMELLNNRLSSSQREAFIQSCDIEDLLSLLEPLLGVVTTIQPEDSSCTKYVADKTNDEQHLNQQTALLSIKYLAKYFGFENYTKFKPILDHVTILLKEGNLSNSNLLASVVLCAAELCSALRAHAIATLPSLMPALIKLLSGQCENHAPDVLQVSLAAATQRVVESLAAFLSPYLHPLLVELCVLTARCTHEEEQGRIANVVIKLKATRQKLATSIPHRVLVPAIDSAFKQLVNLRQFSAVGPLMGILSESFSALSATDLAAIQNSLTEFFLGALHFRSSCVHENRKLQASLDDIDEVEGHVVQALVALVLKMSESSFRPLYYKLFEWATRMQEHKQRTITFYRLSCGFAECLKGLFVMFAGHFLKNASMLLDHCNVSKIEGSEDDELPRTDSMKDRPTELFFGHGTVAERNCCTLISYILKTLYNIFLYDSQNFVSKERFETLMQSIVDQLENPLGEETALQQRASEVLVPCVAQLAAACTDDTLWKQLNYQILLKTRHKLPSVRLVSLEAVCSVARKLGEGFLPLLPETVPFLAELLEDEEESVETACRRVVQDLEQVLGEPIQKYF